MNNNDLLRQLENKILALDLNKDLKVELKKLQTEIDIARRARRLHNSFQDINNFITKGDDNEFCKN